MCGAAVWEGRKKYTRRAGEGWASGNEAGGYKHAAHVHLGHGGPLHLENKMSKVRNGRTPKAKRHLEPSETRSLAPPISAQTRAKMAISNYNNSRGYIRQTLKKQLYTQVHFCKKKKKKGRSFFVFLFCFFTSIDAGGVVSKLVTKRSKTFFFFSARGRSFFVSFFGI